MGEQVPLEDRWASFLLTFFGLGNKLDWPSDDPIVKKFVGKNLEGLRIVPPGPFVLPLVGHDNSTTYYALAIGDDQTHDLRRLLDGFVGPTYSTYNGRSIAASVQSQIDEAAIQFTGESASVFRFKVVGPSGAKTDVREKLLSLLDLARARPARRVDRAQPIGRLLRDFDRAIVDGDEKLASELLRGPLLHSGRLSGLNNLFLEVRFLAGFEHWDELSDFPSLGDLLRTRRPALVSDALAQLALGFLPNEPGVVAQERFEIFIHDVAPRFGALIPSVEAIRSVSGAEYYVLWLLQGGTDGVTIRNQLEGLRYLENEVIQRYLVEVPQVQIPANELDTSLVAEAVSLGQFDLALELLESLPPNLDTLPSLVQTIQNVLSVPALELGQRYREVLGDSVFANAVKSIQKPTFYTESVVLEDVPLSWADRFQSVIDGNLLPSKLEFDAEEGGVLDLLRNPDELEMVIETIGGAKNQTAHLVADAAVSLLKRLSEVIPVNLEVHIGHLRKAVIDLWCLEDSTGNRSLAADVLDQVESFLQSGCSVAEYTELCEELTLRWDPFLTDASFDLSLRVIELMINYRPGDDPSILDLAGKILHRVTPSNIERLEVSDVYVAQALASELELGVKWEFPQEVPEKSDASNSGRLISSIGLYSLDESATKRAGEVLEQLIPGVVVKSIHDKVSSIPLRSLAESVDLMVVATRVAKHPATNAISEARGSKPLVNAAGKGSSSLVRAVLDFLESGVQV